MSLLTEIGQYLADNAIGTQGTDIFLSEMPPSPDAAVCVYRYAGGKGTYHMGGAVGAALENPRFQVIARAATYTAADSKIQSIYALLDAVSHATLSGKRYLRVTAIQAPFDLQKDENGRYRCVCNFEALKEI